jgi:hypothetical protein
MFKVTYKIKGSSQVHHKHFSNRQVAEAFADQCKNYLVSVEEVDNDPSLLEE